MQFSSCLRTLPATIDPKCLDSCANLVCGSPLLGVRARTDRGHPNSSLPPNSLEFIIEQSKNVRVRTTQKGASPAHRLPNQHGIPNPIPLRPFGHGATASRRPYCTQHHFLVALPRRFRRFALAGVSRRAINMMAGLVCGKERNRAATAGHGRQSERREEEGSWLRTRLRYCAPVASSATCAAACW